MTTSQQKCHYYIKGYCKQKDKCIFYHPKTDCEKECNENKCMKRHRKLCKYGNYCYFGNKGVGEYMHKVLIFTDVTMANEENEINEAHKVILNKPETLTEIENQLKKEIEKLKDVIENVYKKEIECLNNKIHEKEKKEKENQEQTIEIIKNLKTTHKYEIDTIKLEYSKKLENINKLKKDQIEPIKNKECEQENEKQNIMEQMDMEHETDMKNDKYDFKCGHCDYRNNDDTDVIVHEVMQHGQIF